MLHTPFYSNAARQVHDAYYNSYIKGALHPDRVMTLHDFVYIVQGSWQIMQGEHCYSVGRDDVVILTAGEHHWGEVPCADGTLTMYLHTDAVPGEQFAAPAQQDGIVLAPVIHCRSHPQVKKLFEAIVNTFSLVEPHRNTRLAVLFNMLLLQLYDAQHAGGEDAVETALQMIHQTPQHFFTNAELADAFYLSDKTLIKHFRARTGMSPYQYQLHYKLNNVAAMLLAHPGMRLYELASNFGFYDEFHLSRVFKKHFGTSPREYRKKARQ